MARTQASEGEGLLVVLLAVVEVVAVVELVVAAAMALVVQQMALFRWLQAQVVACLPLVAWI